MLDRETELAAIAAAADSARAGSGSIVLVEGVAGIGKTRLITHACAQGRQAGMRVLTARAAEFEAGFAWGVVRQLFEPAVQSGGTAWLQDGAARLAAPALRPDAQDGERDWFSVLHGLYWLAATMAQRTPLLIGVDDLHWADEPSQRFVTHLAHRLDGLPILLVVTAREPASATAQARTTIASLASEPAAAILRPAALSAAACAELVSERLGGQPAPAFQAACHEITAGNPLLLHALIAGLAAEGVQGSDADLPHLRRLTPSTVSRSVLLQLGRMPAVALPAARAVAVLGTAATMARAGQLAGLDAQACAEAIAALMAERLVEGDRVLRFVHPLVRSAIYHDFAPPLRRRWHERAARMLDAEGASHAEVTVHLLAAGMTGAPWVVDRLRLAAADARASGAPDIAKVCLERALAEPPPAGMRADVLFELGSVEVMQAPAAAAEHLAEALAATAAFPMRGRIALGLADALALGGRFAAAVSLLGATSAELGDERSELGMAVQAALLNAARWDLGTRQVTRPLLDRLRARADRGEKLDPQLHANLAIELAAAGAEREHAVRHARQALLAPRQLMAASASALPETITVLLFAGHHDEAENDAQAWLRQAQDSGWQLSAAIAASAASLVALYGGAVSEAVSFGQLAAGGSADAWISSIGTAFLVYALIERGAVEAARAELTARDLTGELGPTWPFNVIRYARGCLRAAEGDHAAAIEDLLRAGELAEQWGIRNPAMMPWRSAAALSLSARGDDQRARQLCAEEIELARRWGAGRALGVGLRAAGLVEGGQPGIMLLRQAIGILRGTPAPLELARALIDLGSALRRGSFRAQARELLREGLDIAHGRGGVALADRARGELVIAGGRPRRDARRGLDALTPSELRVAQMAAAGQTNRQIAQALFVTLRTIENHLTSSYGKLGISSRPELRAALDAG
jgi:DNA-binding CsgD family transcriptional regulator